jgi:selenocysteine-specific elongation factor
MLLVRLRSFHKENPLKPGMPKEDVKAMLRAELKSGDRVFELIPFVEGVLVEKDAFRLKDFRVSLSHIDEGLKEKIPMILNKEGFQPPLKAELAQKLSVNEKALDDLLKILVKEGVVVRINDSMHITKEQYEKMLDLLRSFVRKKQDMTVAEFRDMLGTSRKYALPLLEYLDDHKITLRVGDVRKVMVK